MNRTTPSNLLAVLVLLVVLGAALAAGCTSTSTGGKATTAPAGTVAAAGTAVSGTSGPPAGTIAASGTGHSVAAVGYARLIPFIPKSVGAWKLESDPMGMDSKDAEGREYSFVTGIFRKNGDENAEVSVQIHDIAIADSSLKQMWKSYTNVETSEMSMKQITVKGQPAWEINDKSTNNHSLMSLAGERFMVYVLVEDATQADLDAFVNAIDFAGLAAVK